MTEKTTNNFINEEIENYYIRNDIYEIYNF